MLRAIARRLIERAEKRIGVSLDYVHAIARTDIGLLSRYNRVFGMIDPNTKVSALAYHAARIRGAVAADCGSCVEAEINLAHNAGITADVIGAILSGDYDSLAPEIAATARLADAVVGRREDDPEARDIVQAAFGEAGLIELSFAMNGAALLPGIKRAMGYATVCDMSVLRRVASKD